MTITVKCRATWKSSSDEAVVQAEETFEKPDTLIDLKELKKKYEDLMEKHKVGARIFA